MLFILCFNYLLFFTQKCATYSDLVYLEDTLAVARDFTHALFRAFSRRGS